MLYGPFSLSDAEGAFLQFNFWCRSEANFDTLAWAASTDGANFAGFAFTGVSNDWQFQFFDLENVPFLGDLTGRSDLWIAFIFRSDESFSDEGAFLDDIYLNKDAPDGTNQLRCAQGLEWPSLIVVSNQRGTHTQSQPVVGDTAFIDWGVVNLGSRPTSAAFTSRLYIDNTLVQSWRVDPPLNFLAVDSFLDFPYVFTGTGTDTLRMEHDVYNIIAETQDGDNSCQLLVNVGCNPGDYIGTGFGVLNNPQNHIDTRCNGTTFRLQDFTRQLNNNPHGHDGQMIGAIETFNWENGGQVMTDANNVWNASDQASGVDAHVYAGRSYTYLDSVLNRNGFDSIGLSMWSNVERPMVGARARYDYDLKLVEYAPPGGGYRSYAGSIEIVAHEWLGHGVTDFASKLKPEKESGALDESFGDMMGATVSFAYGDANYWQIGEDVTPTGGPISDLSNPLSTGQADTYRGTNWFTVTGCTPSGSNDQCGTIVNSGVPNKMFYLFANPGANFHTGITVNGIGVDNAMKVMYLANERRWNSTTNFLQARQGSIQIADSLNPSWGQELRKAWDAVGVCEHRKADLNGDGLLTSGDVVLALNCIFLTQNCNSCLADTNCSGTLSSADVVLALNMVFLGQSDGCVPL